MQFRQHRFPTRFPVQVDTASGPKMGHVVDVSTEGARLGGLDGLKRGDKIKLDVLSQNVDAVVCWHLDGKTGVRFRAQITDYQVDTLCQRPAARHKTYRGSVGFGHAQAG